MYVALRLIRSVTISINGVDTEVQVDDKTSQAGFLPVFHTVEALQEAYGEEQPYSEIEITESNTHG